MKERLLTNWTFTRALFLVMGSYMVVQSIMTKQWFGLAMGGYFASMGLFAFGCAAGNCAVPSNSNSRASEARKDTLDVEYEEVKK
jgi:multisubunit Na+/H+ antiporter MnhC subunit